MNEPPRAPTVTVVVADDDPDMRLLVRLLVDGHHDLEVVAEAVDGTDAVDVVERLRPPPVPDVLVLDNQMPGFSGLEVADRIGELLPATRIILFSAFVDEALRRQAAAAGIAHVVEKQDIDELPSIIRRTAGA